MEMTKVSLPDAHTK